MVNPGIILFVVKGIQKVLTLSGSTLRTATLKNVKRTTVTDALLDTEIIEVFRSIMSKQVGKNITTEQLSTFIKQNPGEAAIVLYSALSGVEDIYDTIVDLVNLVKDAIFDPSDPDGASTFSSIEKQDGKEFLDTLGQPFGVSAKVQLINATYQNNDDLTQLPCTCGTHIFEVLDVKLVLDGAIEIDKSVSLGCSINAKLTTCERVKNSRRVAEAEMDLCSAYEFLTSFTGDSNTAGKLAQAIAVIIKGEANG